jgi:Na+-driven multidrug efflux pump
MDKKGTRQLSGCVIILFGISFVMASIGVILTLVFGGDLQEYFTNEDGESNFGWFKTMFWILLIAIAAFLIAGGKFSNFKFPEGYVDDEDEKE